MANTALIPALAKSLIAIAWADGEIHPEEEATLKEVLGLLPPMPAREWSVIELYLAVPVLADERAELIEQASSLIRNAADQALAIEAVDNMLHADGVVKPGEEAVAREARAAFTNVNLFPVAVLGRVLGGAFRPRPQREEGLALWQANPVAYYLEWKPNPDELGLRSPNVSLAALAAGIMAQIIVAMPGSSEAERPAMIEALAHEWAVTTEQAAAVADAALHIARRDVDYHRISRELVVRTDEFQRVQLLDTLFNIANTSERVSATEMDTISVIAKRLNLTRQQFITAKLKIAPENRTGL